MKALIVYDYLSDSKCTEQIAKTIEEVFKGRSIDVTSLSVRGIDPMITNNYGCLVVGSPTLYRKPTRAIVSLLEQLDNLRRIGKTDPSARVAASFGTESPGWAWIGGSATREIERTLQGLGFKVIAQGLVTKAMKKGDYEYLVEERELEKAKSFANELATKLSGAS